MGWQGKVALYLDPRSSMIVDIINSGVIGRQSRKWLWTAKKSAEFQAYNSGLCLGLS
jgi:hypothetical protein